MQIHFSVLKFAIFFKIAAIHVSCNFLGEGRALRRKNQNNSTCSYLPSKKKNLPAYSAGVFRKFEIKPEGRPREKFAH